MVVTKVGSTEGAGGPRAVRGRACVLVFAARGINNNLYSSEGCCRDTIIWLLYGAELRVNKERGAVSSGTYMEQQNKVLKWPWSSRDE